MAEEFTVGSDYYVQLVTQEGGVLDVPSDYISSFQKRRESSTETRRGIQGRTMSHQSPNGYSGSFNIDRHSPTIENFFIDLDQQYYEGRRQLPGSILETIREIDGSVSQYEYRGVKFNLEDLGTVEQGKRVTMTLTFTSTDRIRRV